MTFSNKPPEFDSLTALQFGVWATVLLAGAFYAAQVLRSLP